MWSTSIKLHNTRNIFYYTPQLAISSYTSRNYSPNSRIITPENAVATPRHKKTPRPLETIKPYNPPAAAKNARRIRPNAPLTNSRQLSHLPPRCFAQHRSSKFLSTRVMNAYRNVILEISLAGDQASMREREGGGHSSVISRTKGLSLAGAKRLAARRCAARDLRKCTAAPGRGILGV